MKHRFSASLITLSLLLSFVAVPTSALTQIPTEPRVGDRCEKDPKVPAAWKKYQDFTWNYPACPHPYRYVSGKLTSKTPKTAQSDRSELLGVDQCMIANYFGAQRARQARGEILGPNYTLQFVPFQTPDFKVNSNPQKDYKDWVKAMEDVMNKSSDLPFNFKIAVPDKYFMLPNALKSYDVGFNKMEEGNTHPDSAIPNYLKLAQDAVAVADPSIDFSKANHMWIVGPPNTKRKNLINFALYNQTIQTQEKTMPRIYVTDHPYNFDVGNRNTNQKKYGNFIANNLFDGSGALGQMHEWGHSSGTFTVMASVFGGSQEKEGSMDWGLMQKKDGDWLALHKWILQMISDDQVRCASKSKVTTHWLKPSTIKGGYEKLLMVPLSGSDYLAVESIRPYGYSYKIPKCQQGALVYVASRYGGGWDERTIHIPATSKKKGCPGRGISEKGALVKGDSVSYGGVKITVVEAGDFGDVVRVEPGA
jgi:hypothetical protein